MLLPLVSCEIDSSFLLKPETTFEEYNPEIPTTDTESGDSVTISPGEPVIVPNPEIKKDFKNPLTGLPAQFDHTSTRAIAFVIDNTYLSFPQTGLSKVDVLFEVVKKDGTTALMAIVKDPGNASLVGPLGTANTALLDFASAFDAVLFSKNASDTLKASLASAPKDFFAYEINKPAYGFFESSDRKNEYGYAYSVMGEGVRLLSAAKAGGIRVSSDVLFSKVFKFFDGEGENTLPGGISENVFIPASASQKIQLIYSPSTGMYYRYAFGIKPQVDPIDSSAVAFKNILILESDSASNDAPETQLPGTDNTPLDTSSAVPGDTPVTPDDGEEVDLTLSNRGDGFYMTNGKYIRIKWIRMVDGSLKFINEDGSDLLMSEGKTYISVLTEDQMSKIDVNYRR